VGMTQILALQSLDTPSSGVIDHALTERMEVMVGIAILTAACERQKNYLLPLQTWWA